MSWRWDRRGPSILPRLLCSHIYIGVEALNNKYECLNQSLETGLADLLSGNIITFPIT